MKPITSHGFSRRWLGVGMALVAAMAAEAQTAVTFQIDMAPISPTVPTKVSVSGSFNGWPGPVDSALSLINVSGTIWSNTFTISDAPGTIESCKFQYEPGDNWEGINNRQFILGSVTQDLPLTTWNANSTWPPGPTNYVTFQVDMTPQVITKTFINGTSTLTVSGDFEGWNDGLPMTNDPTALALATNIYSGTFPAVGFLPDSIAYKFRANGGWEDGNNRTATITSSSQVLPLTFYNNASLSDLMTSPTLVTFSLYMTNGTPDKDGSPYIKGYDKIYINGNFFAHDSSGTVVPAGTGGYWTWNVLSYPANSGPASAEMVESAIPDVYTNSFLLPAGSGYKLEYKYSQDGYDEENGFQTNHVRYVRSYPPTYVFPQDAWSFVVTPPYPNSLVVEPSFGNLAIGAPAGANLPITWLGRPAVILQHQSSVTGGVWIDDNATDALQATNWPNTGSAQFFRLKKKP